MSRMLYPEGKKGKKRIADDMVEIIESSFGLSRGWMDGISQKEEPKADKNFTYAGRYEESPKYPVISSVQAGAWAEAIEPYTLNDISLWLESDAKIQGKAFWLLVEGDSMTAPTGVSVPQGSYVLFDTGREAINGSLVVAKLSDSNEATFKKLVEDGGNRYLKGLNPNWPIITINGNCKILGVAVESKMRFV